MTPRLALSCLFATTLLACSDATGGLVGGDPLNGGSSSSSGGSGGDGGGSSGGFSPGLSAACMPGGTNGGNGWADLYTCYFGPSGVGSCDSQAGACHAAAGDPGVGFSMGYQCDPTGPSAGCYQKITSVLVGSNTSSPKSTTLYQVLKKPSNDTTPCTVTGPYMCNTMPLSDYSFGAGDLARIAAWIQAGAPNN